METVLLDLAAHNLQNRTVAFIENGSWAPISAKLMGDIVAKMIIDRKELDMKGLWQYHANLE